MDRNDFNKLIQSKPVITDGAWGTRLYQLGLQQGESPEKWNLDAPEKVAIVAREYVEAGSQIILSNSFGGCPIKLAEYQLTDQAEEINRRAAEISKEAAGDKALVFASIGPCGKLLMMGDVEEEELEEAFALQARALAAGGADGLVIETMSCLEEAKIALAAALTTNLPVVVSMAFDSGADKDHTMMGVSAEKAAKELTEAGAYAVGGNCGQGIEGFIAICQKMRAATDTPLWMKANAGLPEVINGETTYKQSPEDFAAKAETLFKEGATFIGGCCGTSPAFIKAVAESL